MIEFPLWDYFNDGLFEEGMNLAFINEMDKQNKEMEDETDTTW